MKRLRLIVIIAGVLLLGWLVFRPTGPKEPSYQGRKLSEWIDEYVATTWNNWGTTPSVNDKTRSQTAKFAVKAIGTNALPTLLEWLQTKDSPLKSRLNDYLDRQSYIHFRFRTPDSWYSVPLTGFALLGEDAKSAIPDLKKLMASGDTTHRRWVFPCICGVDEGNHVLLPFFLEKLHDPDHRIQVIAALHLKDNYPEEAEKAGVFEMFPQFRRPLRNTTQTNSPAAK